MKPEDVKVGMYVKNGRKDTTCDYYGIIDIVYHGVNYVHWDIMWLKPKKTIN